MTRINSGIPVEILSDQHLLAEHREIKRIPRTKFVSVPPKYFTLGTGHILFFSNKPFYTYKRYCDLYAECLRRGFDIEYYAGNWADYGIKYEGQTDYIPTKKHIELVVNRIIDRTNDSKQIPRYYGKPITKEEYIQKLLKLK